MIQKMVKLESHVGSTNRIPTYDSNSNIWHCQSKYNQYYYLCKDCGKRVDFPYTGSRHCSRCDSWWVTPFMAGENIPPCTAITYELCPTCGGDGLVDKAISCSHSRTSRHSYCGHGRVGIHD